MRVLNGRKRAARASATAAAPSPKPVRSRCRPAARSAASLARRRRARRRSPCPRCRCGSACPTARPRPPDRRSTGRTRPSPRSSAPGVNGPLLVVADLAGRRSPTTRCSPQQVDIAQQLSGVRRRRRGRADRRRPTTARTLAFQVVPADGPPASPPSSWSATSAAASPLDGRRQLGVAGQASGNIDISQKLADALPLYLAARRRTLAAHHDPGVPVDPRPADRDRRVHAVAVRGLRRRSSRSSSGAGSAGCSASTTPARS